MRKRLVIFTLIQVIIIALFPHHIWWDLIPVYILVSYCAWSLFRVCYVDAKMKQRNNEVYDEYYHTSEQKEFYRGTEMKKNVQEWWDYAMRNQN